MTGAMIGPGGVDERTAAQIDANLDLTEAFLAWVFEDATRLDEIPNGATIVFEPADDPGLACLNREAADRLREEGTPVHVLRV